MNGGGQREREREFIVEMQKKEGSCVLINHRKYNKHILF